MILLKIQKTDYYSMNMDFAFIHLQDLISEK
jgi:hypothetical protein